METLQEDIIATSVTLKLRSPAESLNLFGQNDENLRLLRSRLRATVIVRGDELRLSGDDEAVREAERTFERLLSAIRRGETLSRTELEFGDLLDPDPDTQAGNSGAAAAATPTRQSWTVAGGGGVSVAAVAMDDHPAEEGSLRVAGRHGRRPGPDGLIGGSFADVNGAGQGVPVARHGRRLEEGAGAIPTGSSRFAAAQAATTAATTDVPDRKDGRRSGRAKAKTAGQARYIDAIARFPIVFGSGPAGTGKTYLAVAMAVEALTNRRVKRIILTRPAVEAGEKLGFLPGDLQAKIDPYLRPLYDALYDMLPTDRVEKLLELGTIEVAPLAFMRGRTLNDAFIILDEAQNTTAEQMKMFLTRMGFNSKVVITGDTTQTDLPGSVKSGLLTAQRILAGIDGIGFIEFSKADVVRHPLVAQIILAYEEHG